MSQEKADNGTVILNSNGAVLGVIKKIYSNNLARLELSDGKSIALDLDLISEITTQGRLIKKKNATLTNEANDFFAGAAEILNQLLLSATEILAGHLATKETKKALQHFEFDFLTQTDFIDELTIYQLLGLIRGIELASKTAQDFILKTIFQIAEDKTDFSNQNAPEIIVDKLNQEKAFMRLFWNYVRFCVAKTITYSNEQLIYAISEALFEIGLKYIDIEYKESISTMDVLQLYKRLEDCIIKYIFILINELEEDKKQNIWEDMTIKYTELIRKTKINSTVKEQASKLIESVDFSEYEQYKSLELLHSGIRGFNLKVMSEKKAMIDLKTLVDSLIDQEEPCKVMLLQKEITEFIQNVRDVSKEFSDVLFEMVQFLKKIEYGDSKVQDYYTSILDKINKHRFFDLTDIINKLNNTYAC
jgi:hypothetical protein